MESKTYDLLGLMLYGFQKFIEDNEEKTTEEIVMEYDLKLYGDSKCI